MGIEVIGTAKNGKEALELTKNLCPDIIITDVKMPIMDGLEFSKKIKQLFPNIKIVFLSGYDDFKFIKTAIDIDAVGYLLKPIDIKELQLLMIKVKKRCEDQSLISHSILEIKKKHIKDLIFEKDNSKKESLALKTLNIYSNSISPNKNEFIIFIVSVDNYKLFENHHLNSDVYSFIEDIVTNYTDIGIVCNFKEWQYCVVLPSVVDETINLNELYITISKGVLDNFNTTISICTSHIKDKIINLDKLYESIQNCLDYTFYLGKSKIIYYQDITTYSVNTDIIIPSIYNKLLPYIAENDICNIFLILDGFFEFVLKEKVAKRTVTLALFDLFNKLFENLSISFDLLNLNISNKTDLWSLFFSINYLEDLRKLTIDIIKNLIQRLVEEHTNINHKSIIKIISIIHMSYDKLITVEDLAKGLYISPNYLRTLFKEKTGETILQYLTKVRIKKATELLKDNSLKIQDISLKVGYENVSYFCSIFHKYKGLTPNEYRRKLL